LRLETTDDHPFYVPGTGFINTIDLYPGLTIETKDGANVTVTSVLKTDRYQTTYNLEVADFHTYYVTEHDVLVHNCDITQGTNKGGLKGEPNSIHVQTSSDGKKAVQSTVYDCNGNACAHVDWKNHSYGSGKAAPGHGHRIDPPGTREGIRGAHGPGAEHISPGSVPSAWKKLPDNLESAE